MKHIVNFMFLLRPNPVLLLDMTRSRHILSLKLSDFSVNFISYIIEAHFLPEQKVYQLNFKLTPLSIWNWRSI